MAVVGGGPLGVESLEVGGLEITADLGDELVGWDHGELVWGRCGVWSAVEMCFGRGGREEGREEVLWGLWMDCFGLELVIMLDCLR